LLPGLLQLLLLENVRFYKEETKNDAEFAKKVRQPKELTDEHLIQGASYEHHQHHSATDYTRQANTVVDVSFKLMSLSSLPSYVMQVIIQGNGHEGLAQIQSGMGMMIYELRSTFCACLYTHLRCLPTLSQ
jgi:hypothetical protein